MSNAIWVTGRQFYQEALGELRCEVEHDALLVREPTNPYDSNAVVVMVGQHKIGYLPREKAEKLAAILDPKGVTQLTAKVQLFAPTYNRKQFAAQLTAITAP